jgi:hypothetical protein
MKICATARALALDVPANSGFGCPFFIIAKADGIIAELNSRIAELNLDPTLCPRAEQGSGDKMKASNLAKNNRTIDETVSQRLGLASNIGLLEFSLRSLEYCYRFSRMAERKRDCAGSMGG